MTEEKRMDKDEIKTSESRQLNNFDLFKKVIKHIQKHAAAFTFLTASTVAFGGIVIRCIMYLFEYGKTIYYNVSPLLIDVSGDNVLYDFFVKGIAALVFVLLNLIPYFIWTGNKNVWIKIGLSLLIAAIPDLAIVFALLSDAFHGMHYSGLNIFCYMLFGIFLGAIFLFVGLFCGICEFVSTSKQKKAAKNKEDKETKIETKNDENELTTSKKINKFIIQMSAIFAVELILFIVAGWDIAFSQNHFKIINDGEDIYYAVVYENPNRYVITECEIEGGYISFPKRDIQQEIDRDSVEYQWQKLTQKR